ncbi:DUF748 domain-containing protein [Pseudomonas sp. UL073]|uniref:DUF748 domain-containing protein n=1 Tax=Zestomonas insulae TaxID=2809017 RepID=A0ABS2IJ79_9GAMM|nr:DUF748 domain-containing protein [Pseudomonas insulae]MBM7063117.1 DUF748 domain-containing protein [Pseudomonas insulae]
MYKGLKRAVGALLVAVGLYCLLGFLIVPGVALHVINQQLAKFAKVPAHLERLEFNPFSLELTLWNLHVGEGETPQAGFQRLYADLQLDSLWTRRLHLADLELEKSHTEVLFAEDGTLNLTQLFAVPPSEPTPADAPPSEPFPLRIDRIALIEGGLHFQDLRPSEPVEFGYDSLNFELKNLSTVADDQSDMTLVAKGPYGGRIDWSGEISVVPFTSKGHLQLSHGSLKAFWPYVRDVAPLALEKGVLSLSADYQLNLAKGTELLLSNVSSKLEDLALKTPDGRPLVNLQTLEIGGTSVDLVKQEVVVGTIRSQGLETWAAREKDGQLDWQKLFANYQPPKRPAPKPVAAPAPAADVSTPSAEAAAPAPAAAATPAPAPAPTPAEQPATTAAAAPDATAAPAAAPAAEPEAPAKPWQVLLVDTQLRNYRVHLADRQPATPVDLELGPLNLDLQNFDSLNQSPFTLKLDTGLGKQGKIGATGTVNLVPISAQLKVTTQDIDLRVAQAYIDPFIRLELRSGLLGSDLDVDLKSTEPLAFSVRGRAVVNQLHTLDTLKERDFVKWQTLTLDGLDYLHDDRLEIAKVSFKQPYARFMINEDRTTNVNDLLIPQPASPTGHAQTGQAAAKPAASKPLGIRIGAIVIDDGSANFADFSLRPNFATAIQQLNGQIGTLDSRKPQPAKVTIKGKVDRYAPVSILGSVNPFDPLDSLDLTTSFKNVELTTLTPYSGKFAGYRIRKGRLNLDLHYQIEKKQLKAENKLVVEKLQLGEKVDSPDAVDLPIKLAVALLKDTEGKISIELPVEGNLDDPQFSVMPIVWQTLRNLVLRAAQAPFKFIAGLVGGSGDVDLSSVAFAPGSSELDKPAQGNLDTLSKALKERPLLRLEVEGASAQSSDGALLAEQRLQREYQSTYYKILQRRGDKVPADAKQLEVPEGEQRVLLEGIYRTRLKQQPPAEWKELGSDERETKLREAVLQSWGQSELLLRQLAQARAAAIKDYLVDKGGLPDERIYLIDARLGEAEADGKVVTALNLDSE